MDRVLWPVEIRTEGSVAIWSGRLLHWLLTGLAFVVIALSIVVSGVFLLGEDLDSSMWSGSVGWLSAIGSLAGVALFCVGRSLRFMLARE
jgi:hypothetical protein